MLGLRGLITSLSTDSECWPANIAHLQTSIAILDFECTFCSTALLNTSVPISNWQLLLDCLVQYIDRKFNNQNVTKETQTKFPSPKFALSIVAEKQQRCVCIMSVNEGLRSPRRDTQTKKVRKARLHKQ